MKIVVGDFPYTVTEEAQKDLQTLAVAKLQEQYERLPVQYKIIADQIARKMLYDMEKKAVEKGVPKEDAKQIRPEKNESSALKMLSFILQSILQSGLLDDAAIVFETEGNDNKIYGLELVYGQKI